MSMKKNTDAALMVLRIGIGILFLLHGIAKIKGGTGFIEEQMVKNALPSQLAYLVYMGEVIAPVMMIVGFRTKLAAFIIMGTIGFIIFLTGMDKFGQLTQVGAWALEVQALFFTGALALFLAGGGKYAASHKHKWD